ncbi:MAG: M28 family metallopeptidase [Candidatus Binatia bacterium]
MTQDRDRTVIILDTSSMLGSITRNAANEPTSLELFSNVVPLLEHWQPRARIGATIDVDASRKNPLPTLLRAHGVLDFFDRDLLLPSATLAAASVTADMRVLASGGRVERNAAMEAGYRVVPHLALVDEALAGEPLCYAQLRVKRGHGTIDDVVRSLPIVPVHRPTTERNTLYVITSARTLALLRQLGPDAMWVKEYQHPAGPSQGAPANTDLFFVHECLDASAEAAAFRAAVKKQVKIWWRLDDGLVLALDSTQAIDDFHPPHGGCGRVRLFVPTRAVLREPEIRLPEIRRAEAARVAHAAAQPAALSAAAETVIAGLDAKMIDDHWRCWVGKAPLPAGGPPIVSRHVNHPDNVRAVDALVSMLARITGHPARKLDIRSHSRWYNVEGVLRGASAKEFVAVSAHLDSIALDSAKVAPGGDDDASGTAAVLAIATILRKLADTLGKPKRDVRFLFFNAEELYMIGSNDYAVALTRKTNASVPVALVQLDMVGVPSSLAPTRTWELHPPGPDDYRTTLSPSARNRSLAIADLIERCGNADPKAYAIDSPVKKGATQDPLAKRSDHSSFLLYGFPACAVTEDAFGVDANTDPAFAHRYHRKADVHIDPEYTATIARAVVGALASRKRRRRTDHQLDHLAHRNHLTHLTHRRRRIVSHVEDHRGADSRFCRQPKRSFTDPQEPRHRLDRLWCELRGRRRPRIHGAQRDRTRAADRAHGSGHQRRQGSGRRPLQEEGGSPTGAGRLRGLGPCCGCLQRERHPHLRSVRRQRCSRPGQPGDDVHDPGQRLRLRPRSTGSPVRATRPGRAQRRDRGRRRRRSRRRGPERVRHGTRYAPQDRQLVGAHQEPRQRLGDGPPGQEQDHRPLSRPCF